MSRPLPSLPALVVAALCAAAALALPAAAAAKTTTVTATSGQVTATLSYTRKGDLEYRGLHLHVTRAGVTALEQAVETSDCASPYCIPGGTGRKAVAVRDLDGDGEPEVLLDLFTGGAHCCSETVVYSWSGSAYGTVLQQWGDPGYRLADAPGGGRPEFVSADPRFSGLYTSFAASGFPVQVWSYAHGAFADVTGDAAHRRRVERDADRWMKIYRRVKRDQEPQGVLAAWAADRYRLGDRTGALRFVRASADHGKLSHWAGRTRFAARLDTRLLSWGYAAASAASAPR